MASDEYNKIHAMALARRKVMQIFGANLLCYYPLADENQLIRDLLRQRCLTGNGVTMQQPGLIDYAVDLQSGYISDTVKTFGDSSLSFQNWQQADWHAIVVPPGRWKGMKFKSNRTAMWHNVRVAPANTPASQVSSNQIFGVTTSYSGSPDALHSCTFPFPLDAETSQWWAYIDGSQHSTAGNSASTMTGYYWTGSAWNQLSGYDIPIGEFNGVEAESWPTYSKFTIAAWVNVDNSPCNGVVVALADASLAKAQISVTSDKKARGEFTNQNGITYTLTASKALHRGFNLVTVSYEQNVAVKLGVNGQVVATATPSNYGLFNTTLALCVGALMKTDKTTSSQLKNALVDDVFLAGDVLTDGMLWSLYTEYITAAPLMRQETA